jgi:hypothetical protein
MVIGSPGPWLGPGREGATSMVGSSSRQAQPVAPGGTLVWTLVSIEVQAIWIERYGRARHENFRGNSQAG